MFIDNYKLVLLVAETHSFSKAARLMHLSQPAVSSKVQSIEDYYGIKLFNRTNQGVTLTEAGQVICAHALRFVDLQDSMDQDIRALLNNSRQWLTIGSSCTVGNYAMPFIIGRFKEKYPDASIKLEIGNSKDIINRLIQQDLDVAVVEGTVNNPLLKIHDLGTLPLILIDQPGKRKKKEEISVKGFTSRPQVLREEGAAVRRVIEDVLEEKGYRIEDLEVALEATSIHSVKAAVQEGFGVSLVPSLAVQNELAAGTLRELVIKNLTAPLQMGVTLAFRDEEGSIICKQFIKHVMRLEKFGQENT